MDLGVTQIFGPWLPWLFGVGTVLLVCGLVVGEFGTGSVLAGLGRGAANVGWRMMLFAAAIYIMARVLEGVFQSMMSNLPGM